MRTSLMPTARRWRMRHAALWSVRRGLARVDEGYVCRQCGRRWRAADCLRELVGRARFDAERWPSAKIMGTGPKLHR